MDTLPFLPGYVFDYKPGKTRYVKSHHLDVLNNVPQLVTSSSSRQVAEQRPSVFPRDEPSPLPGWLRFDKHALCFNAYWYHSIREMRHEDYRVHNVKIYYFLEDDTIQVVNFTPFNTGLPEGIINRYIFIKRHRIRLPSPNDDKFYSVRDFNVGRKVEFYGKTFDIIACNDAFTENYLRGMGIVVPPRKDTPIDPATEQKRQERNAEGMPLRPYAKKNTLRQYLDYDKQVLRFYGYWDDTKSMFGDVHEVILLYYLADDTVEVRERILPNMGRDAFPVFIKRGKMPKKLERLPLPGHHDVAPVLNVVGSTDSSSAQQHLVYDSLRIGEQKVEYYTDRDLMIGAFVNAWGRKIVLCDCDEYTREFYRTKYGITDFMPLERMTKSKSQASAPAKIIPPHDGIGTEEDSLQNVFRITPRTPTKNFTKFIELDRQPRSSNILRFLARFAEPTALTYDRLFIIYYYLMDDTILIYEPVRRNSGIVGGKFLSRQRVKKAIRPNPQPGNLFSSFYAIQDFQLGVVMDMNGFDFIILDADEYCLRYMEERPAEFPQANVEIILKKIKRIVDRSEDDLKTLAKFDPLERGTIGITEFRTAMCFAAECLTEHEVITLARRYGKLQKMDMYALECLVGLAQRQLRKVNFEDYGKLLEMLRNADIRRSGVLPRKSVYAMCRSFHFPVQAELLQLLIDKLEPIENDEVNYEQFVQLLNWCHNKTKIKIPSYVVFDTLRMECPQMFDVDEIRYREFVQDLETMQID